MASLQSTFIRPFARFTSLMMSRAGESVLKLRDFASAGSQKPILPKGLAWERVSVEGIPCEWMIPTRTDGWADEAVILHLHGGGWVLGLYNNHRWKAAHLGLAAGCRTLAVDYRTAPEYPFPAALDDCVTVYRGLLTSGVLPNQIIIVGDSAGGNLTLATALVLREEGDPLPAGLVCISPMTDLACTGETYWKARDPMLSPHLAQKMALLYAGNTPLDHPLLSPNYADLRDLPPILIQAGEDELLLSDAIRLAERARAAGVDTRLDIWPGMWHVWHIFTPYLPEAREAVEDVGKFVREVLSSQREFVGSAL